MSYSSKQALSVLRSIATELRKANPKMSPISKTPAMQYILNQYRIHQLTDQRLCRRENDLLYLANTYLCYLQSTRKYEDLFSQYYSQGERSVEATARLVGLSLPNKKSSEKVD